ncbi:MAG: hypothetical protein GQ583_01650 [Methyloprofundus sp.]|nr:hypothetical protein [Methyloprofundus sp.]
MSTSSAWLLSLGASYQAAVGLRDMVHLIAEAETFAIPQAPFYCHQTILWQGQIVPLIDLEGWLTETATDNDTKYVAIVAYQMQGKIEYGALSLSTPPKRIQVEDSQSCPLPDEPVLWRKISNACFNAQDTAIPILELATIFHTLPE